MVSTLLQASFLAMCVLLASLPPSQANHAVGFRPVVSKGDGRSNTCTSDPTLQETISDRIRATIRTSGIPKVRKPDTFPCSGPEWTRVVFLNMSDPTHTCPEAWHEYNDVKRVCGRKDIRQNGYCNSLFVDTNGVEYSKVCGRVIGYPKGTVDAFEHNIKNPNLTAGSLDGHYVDGISITHGYPPPRTHIWTLAAGHQNENLLSGCPCQGPNVAARSPDFIENNYFCESGSWEDPLWDGQGCETDWCCSFNSPPWFSVTLASPTRKQLEIRNCGSNRRTLEDTLVELMELYIQ